MMSELPVVSVHLSPSLRPMAGGAAEVMASGETVAEVLESVGHQYPALLSRLVSAEGTLADGVAIYLGGIDVQKRLGLATGLGQEECLNVAMSGDVEVHSAGLASATHQEAKERPISIGN